MIKTKSILYFFISIKEESILWLIAYYIGNGKSEIL